MNSLFDVLSRYMLQRLQAPKYANRRLGSRFRLLLVEQLESRNLPAPLAQFAIYADASMDGAPDQSFQKTFDVQNFGDPNPTPVSNSLLSANEFGDTTSQDTTLSVSVPTDASVPLSGNVTLSGQSSTSTPYAFNGGLVGGYQADWTATFDIKTAATFSFTYQTTYMNTYPIISVEPYGI